MTPQRSFAYYRHVTPFNRRYSALVVALFVGALALAFFFHDAHDRACAETCHICSFTKASHAVDLTTVVELEYQPTCEGRPAVSHPATPGPAAVTPAARAPPSA